jgi:hypothetical protein
MSRRPSFLFGIESLNESYVACVQSAFVRRLDDFAVNGNLPQAPQRAFLDCQIEENALYHNCRSLLRTRACSGDRPDPCRGRATQG